MKRPQTISVLADGNLFEVIQRPVVKGAVCYKGKFYNVKDGTIDYTADPDAIHKREEERRIQRAQEHNHPFDRSGYVHHSFEPTPLLRSGSSAALLAGLLAAVSLSNE